jgi:hypothetical protein
MKRKQRKVSFEAKAVSILGNVEGQLYSLAALGEQGDKLTIEPFTLSKIISDVIAPAQKAFTEALEILPSKHATREHIKPASDALSSLWVAMDCMEQCDEASDGKLGKAYRRMAGQVICFYVGFAGRALERALEALGETPNVGYLDGYLIEPDMMSVSNERARYVANVFPRCREDSQAAIYAFAKKLAERDCK